MTYVINSRRRERQAGQVTIMVTFAIFALCGVLGLAVDLGWAFFVQRAEQGAADAGALAAVRYVMSTNPATVDCGGAFPCLAQAPCVISTTDALGVGCSYVAANGYTNGGDNGRQTVKIASGSGTPPTAPGVSSTGTLYWVTVRVSTVVPQLFSAVLGNTNMNNVSARATGAVVYEVVPGSLILLGRANDNPPGGPGKGINLDSHGGGTVNAGGGIIMDSTASNAGYVAGNGTITGSSTSILGSGGVDLIGNASWEAAPVDGFADSKTFQDPMSGKGQPPITTTVLPAIPVGNGGTYLANKVLQPGNYYAVDSTGKATGKPITLSSGDTFASGFNNYIFYGGLNFTSGTITFSPGVYVLAGTTGGNSVFQMNNNTTITDLTGSGTQSDAGELFIFTDLNYPGLAQQYAGISGISSLGLTYGSVGFQTGNNSSSGMTIHGLNPSSANLPTSLDGFTPFVMWQDQGNSNILYNANGTIDTSCSGGSINTPCANPNKNINPEFHLQATPNLNIAGAMYQPRGADMTFQGRANVNDAYQIITGSLTNTGSGVLNLTAPASYVTTLTAALVE